MKKSDIKLFASSGLVELLSKENALALNKRLGGHELYDLNVLYGIFEFVIFKYEKKHDILMWTVQHGYLEIVKFLVISGANIRAKNNYAVCKAASEGHLEIVKYLAEAGANIHVKNDTALCWAAEGGHLDVVKYLVDAGADIHSKGNGPLRHVWET